MQPNNKDRAYLRKSLRGTRRTGYASNVERKGI
jgi:hypothetical protein